MKRILLLIAMILPFAANAQTAVIQDSTDLVKVLSYSPLPGPQIARQVCEPVVVTAASGGSPGAAVAGGLVGALVGSRFGGGNGRAATTIAGAIGGAMLGKAIGSGAGPDTESQCSTVFDQGPPAGYQVTYDYKGKLLMVTLRQPPGEYLKIHNRVTID